MKQSRGDRSECAFQTWQLYGIQCMLFDLLERTGLQSDLAILDLGSRKKWILLERLRTENLQVVASVVSFFPKVRNSNSESGCSSMPTIRSSDSEPVRHRRRPSDLSGPNRNLESSETLSSEVLKNRAIQFSSKFYFLKNKHLRNNSLCKQHFIRFSNST